MKRDFTLEIYRKLLFSIERAGYSFQTLQDYIEQPKSKVVILRHDSDIWPKNDLRFAVIENNENIKASYYFRIPKTYNSEIIKKITELGHEIGYHYENLADTNGNYSKAIKSFEANLAKLRQIYPVKTVAMHGRPLSKWDSRLLWEKYSLEDFDLTGEPYKSIDYNEVFYLTDTGNRWNGGNVSIRDTVISKYNFSIKTTFDLIRCFGKDDLPDQIMINAHAARWNDDYCIWLYRFFLQKAKNTAKYYFKQLRKYLY